MNEAFYFISLLVLIFLALCLISFFIFIYFKEHNKTKIEFMIGSSFAAFFLWILSIFFITNWDRSISFLILCASLSWLVGLSVGYLVYSKKFFILLCILIILFLPVKYEFQETMCSFMGENNCVTSDSYRYFYSADYLYSKYNEYPGWDYFSPNHMARPYLWKWLIIVSSTIALLTIVYYGLIYFISKKK
jgi:hypothetical protein